jgi:hypothetical protein
VEAKVSIEQCRIYNILQSVTLIWQSKLQFGLHRQPFGGQLRRILAAQAAQRE